MRFHLRFLTAAFSFCLIASVSFSQTFDLETYRKFLTEHENLTSEAFHDMYPTGLYKGWTATPVGLSYLDEVIDSLKLTEYEASTLVDDKYMATERLAYESFGAAFADIFHKDLPVFITTDAILHALHMSYDAMLKHLETHFIHAKLKVILEDMHNGTALLADKYSAYPGLDEMINDLDVYFTVSRSLLDGSPVKPLYDDNREVIDEIMAMINEEKPKNYPLFSGTPKILDFSQFTPRGHYTETELLTNYFKTMIWLGRTEFYLIAPESVQGPKQTPEDVRRQIIDAVLISELAQNNGINQKINDIDQLIKTLVGESDNVKVEHIAELMDESAIPGPVELLDLYVCETFKETLVNKPYAAQKILSQILIADPMDTESIKPASAFMLFGQRFVIDSYVFSNVVYDKIRFKGTDIKRMMPSSYDVLFSLGNNAAGELLEPELAMYPYASNLSAMRYLVDSFEDDFWGSSFYNSWLESIRTLNPPDEVKRKTLPEFMQTPSYWQSKMNTQLASWAQLRHDNLLYAKQSYTGGASCSYPYAYLEPIPEFYAAVATLASNAKVEIVARLMNAPSDKKWMKDKIVEYYSNLEETCNRLEGIAEKELSGEYIGPDNAEFLCSVYKLPGMCGQEADGWYYKLFYDDLNDLMKPDYIVADVHTQPTDEVGNPVGKVLHVGTGKINLSIIITGNWYGDETVFVGPVFSYYEYISMNFKRLTDEEWEESFMDSEALRPSFVDLYLADKSGKSRSAEPVSLPTTVNSVPGEADAPSLMVAPNPFSESVYITIPNDLLSLSKETSISLSIVDMKGNTVRALYDGALGSNNYMFQWDGADDSGKLQPSGVYLYNAIIGDTKYTGKIILSR